MEDQPTIVFEGNPFFPSDLVAVNEQSFKIQDIKDNYDLTHQLFRNKSSSNSRKNEGKKR